MGPVPFVDYVIAQRLSHNCHTQKEPSIIRSRTGPVVFQGPQHPEPVAKVEEQDANKRRQPRQDGDRIGPQDHQAGIICNERDRQYESKYKTEYRIKYRDRVLCIILQFKEEIQNIERILDPKTCCSRSVLQCDHHKRGRYKKNDQLHDCNKCYRHHHFMPGIDDRSDPERQLSESFNVKDLRLEVEKHVDRAETVLNEIPVPYIYPKAPVIVKKALDRRNRYKRKAVKEQHLVVVPSVDRGKIPKQYPETDKPCHIRKYHSKRGDNEIRSVAHFAFNILREYLAIDPYIK